MANLVDLDVIIGGHSHTLQWTKKDGFIGFDMSDETKIMADYPTVEKNVNDRPIPICHVFEYGKYLGNIEITFKKKGDRYVIEKEDDFVGKPILLGELFYATCFISLFGPCTVVRFEYICHSKH